MQNPPLRAYSEPALLPMADQMRCIARQITFPFEQRTEDSVQSLEMRATGRVRNGTNGHDPVLAGQPLPFTFENQGSGIVVGDARELLKQIPGDSFRCCITSPPYWGLRDYGVEDQIGAEAELDRYIEHLTGVFSEVRRLLAPDGTLWLNIGDAYTSGNRTWRDADRKNPARGMKYRPPTPSGLKPKDLVGIPWKLAFALQADGWYLRSDVVWYKPNCQPESVKDRPTRSHEYVFLLTKSEDYYYNWEAVREPSLTKGELRNRRTVWQVNTEPFAEAHFATFPPKLIEPMLLAGTEPGDIVLDPFLGSGTVGQVCQALGRKFVGIELKPEYAQIALNRLGWQAVPNETPSPISHTQAGPPDLPVFEAPVASRQLLGRSAQGGS